MKSQSFNVFMSGIANSPRGSSWGESGTAGSNAAKSHEEKINQLEMEKNMRLIEKDSEISAARRQSPQCFK